MTELQKVYEDLKKRYGLKTLLDIALAREAKLLEAMNAVHLYRINHPSVFPDDLHVRLDKLNREQLELSIYHEVIRCREDELLSFEILERLRQADILWLDTDKTRERDRYYPEAGYKADIAAALKTGDPLLLCEHLEFETERLSKDDLGKLICELTYLHSKMKE
jgi:hypothetical protein